MRSFLLCIVFLAVFWPSAASAHTLSTDGTIGAVMHADPNDDPIVGSPSPFFFDFKDTDGKLVLADCTCTMSVKENGAVISSQPLVAGSSSVATVTYTFPEKGVYSIIVTGTPTTVGEFQSFSIQYDLRVERGADPSLKGGLWGYLSKHLITGLIGVAVVAMILYQVFVTIKQSKR